MSAPYDEDDAAEDTDSTVGEVKRAWHNAREDAVDTDYEVRDSKGYVNDRSSYYDDDDEE